MKDREPIKGFGITSFLFEKDQQFRVQNSLINWKNQEGTVIGLMPGTKLTDRTGIDYLIVDWDEGGRSGISRAMAKKI